jgi:hypothetical protein
MGLVTRLMLQSPLFYIIVVQSCNTTASSITI